MDGLGAWCTLAVASGGSWKRGACCSAFPLEESAVALCKAGPSVTENVPRVVCLSAGLLGWTVMAVMAPVTDGIR